jgi:hypothetical protein
MTYTPKTWTTSDPVAVSDLLHLDTQYSEISADLAAHVIAGHPAVYYPKTTADSYFWNAGNDGDGSGLDADTLSGLHAASISGGVASGIMFWWYPGNGAVPAGYYFCDGSNGTYDMRNRFPIGASGTLSVGSTVGNATISAEGTISIGACTLTVANIAHLHTLLDAKSANSVTVASGGFGQPCLNRAIDNPPTASAGGGGSHAHNDLAAPSTFAGDSKSLDPLFQYLVIIQKS